MIKSDIVIAGYAETPIQFRTHRTAYDLGGEVFSALLASTGIEPGMVDGVSITTSISEAGNNFLANYMCEALGLTPQWLNTSSLGGASVVAGVARAASAIRDGQCEAVIVLSADAPSTRTQQVYGAYRNEFMDPTGILNPPPVFGMLMCRYAHQHGLDVEALGRIVLTQRQHAILNENACSKLKVPISIDDYLSSRVIADPLRLLDCVMYCDGANAVFVTTEKRAQELGLKKMARIAGYAEITNHNGTASCPDIMETGFDVVAPRVYAESGLAPKDISMVQLYDDFTIAVLMQLEAFGFCSKGEGSAYVLKTDLSSRGVLPLNTGGGQLSAGQPGLAGGGVMVAEAVRQLFGEAGQRQIANARNALITGLGVIPYMRGWSTSAAMILEV